MRGEIEVLQPGLYSTIQDGGRFGFLKFGVPVSGAMDSYSAKMANLLLQNQEDAAVMEITQMGPKLKFTGSGRIVICGANLSPQLNKIGIENFVPYTIHSGDILTFGKRRSGCRAYLGISGGFSAEEVLGSRSWYEGITKRFRLEKGMSLAFEQTDKPEKQTHTSLKFKTGHLETRTVPVYAGPEFQFLKPAQQELLLKSEFSVDQNNNRMAVQLKETLQNDLDPILTGPVLPGTGQLTPSGKIIILMRDCQTTGGYPRILQLSENGINVVSQKVTGDRIQFSIVP